MSLTMAMHPVYKNKQKPETLSRFGYDMHMRLTRIVLAAALAALPCMALAQAPATPAAAPAPEKMIPPTTSLTIVVNGKSTTYTLAQIAAMPHKTITVYNLHDKKSESYSGVAMADLLTANGAPFNHQTQHDMLNSYILAKGMDNYTVIYSTVEVYTPDYHAGDVLVADTRDGKPIVTDGLRLVSSEDTHPMRWMHCVTTLTLVQTGK
jgi:hypothetical protein